MASVPGFAVNITMRSNHEPRGERLSKTLKASQKQITKGKQSFAIFSSTTPNNLGFSVRRETSPFGKIRKSVSRESQNIQDIAIYVTYICSMISITLPVILIPMIAADPVLPSSNVVLKSSGAALTGEIVAMSSLGAGIGKVLNGFVCQGFGSRLAGSIYLLAMATFAFLLSITSSLHAFAVAGMEFCASIMWPVCNVLIANRYGNDPEKFVTAITTLSLGSTAGSLACKLVGSALLSRFHWREVARVATIACSLGASMLYFVVKERDVEKKSLNFSRLQKSVPKKENFSIKQASSSMQRVLSNKMFWLVAAAHSCTFLGRSCDKILGSLLHDVTLISKPLCASLTSLVTIGFMVGLITGRKMQNMNFEEQKKFVLKRHIGAVLSAFSIAIMSTKMIGSILHKNIIAATITLASGTLASNLAVQFYQFPAKFASSFGDDKAVCVSFIDGVAFFVNSPIWKHVGNIVAGGNYVDAWPIVWAMLTAFFALGTGLTMKTIKEK